MSHLAADNLLMSDIVVFEQNQDSHHDMFRNGLDIRARNLGDSDLGLVGCIKIDVVGTYSGCYTQLEIGSLRNAYIMPAA